jgi:hypothetical protein
MKTSKLFMFMIISMLLITSFACKNNSADREHDEEGEESGTDSSSHSQKSTGGTASFRIETNYISIKNYCKADSVIWYPEAWGLDLPFIIKDRYVQGSNEGIGTGRFRSIDEDFFEYIGIDLIQGRYFNEDYDNNLSPWVVIINEAAKRRYWKDTELMGQQIVIGPPQFPDMKKISTIVGMVRDLDDVSQDSDSRPNFYTYRTHIPDRWATQVATATEEQREKHWSVSLHNKSEWPSKISLGILSKSRIGKLVLHGDIIIPETASIRDTELAGSLYAVIRYPTYYEKRKYIVNKRVVYIPGFIRESEDRRKIIFTSVQNSAPSTN